MTLLTFEQALINSDRGVIIACNLLDAEVTGLVSRDHLVEFVRLWRDAYDVLISNGVAEPSKDIVEALDILVDPAAALADFGLTSPRDFRFLKPCDLPAESVVTVRLAGVLERMFDGATRRRFETEGVRFPFSVTLASGDAEVELMMGLDPAEARLEIGDWGFGDRAIWITAGAAMDRAMAGVAEGDRADRARDVLGLVNREEGQVVVSVALPAPALPRRRMARPTLFDGANARFTSFPLEVVTGMSLDWGWTFDLRALFNPGQFSAGMPERICDHEPVAGFKGHETEFTPLGIVRIPRNDPDSTYDGRFAARQRRARDLEADIGKLR